MPICNELIVLFVPPREYYQNSPFLTCTVQYSSSDGSLSSWEQWPVAWLRIQGGGSANNATYALCIFSKKNAEMWDKVSVHNFEVTCHTEWFNTLSASDFKEKEEPSSRFGPVYLYRRNSWMIKSLKTVCTICYIYILYLINIYFTVFLYATKCF